MKILYLLKQSSLHYEHSYSLINFKMCMQFSQFSFALHAGKTNKRVYKDTWKTLGLLVSWLHSSRKGFCPSVHRWRQPASTCCCRWGREGRWPSPADRCWGPGRTSPPLSPQSPDALSYSAHLQGPFVYWGHSLEEQLHKVRQRSRVMSNTNGSFWCLCVPEVTWDCSLVTLIARWLYLRL